MALSAAQKAVFIYLKKYADSGRKGAVNQRKQSGRGKKPQSAFRRFRRSERGRIAEIAAGVFGEGSVFQGRKKKLLRIALKETGVDFDPERFEAQMGTIFSPLELNDAASPLAKFAKENKKFKILGAYDLEKKNFLPPRR